MSILVSQRVISEEIEKIVVRDLFGTGFAELTTLLDVPLVDGTQGAVS
jgi:hypothetical protein